MSVITEITRLTGLRNRLRTKLVALALLDNPDSADFQDCVEAVEDIVNVNININLYTLSTTSSCANNDYLAILSTSQHGAGSYFVMGKLECHSGLIPSYVISCEILRSDIVPPGLSQLCQQGNDYLLIWNVMVGPALAKLVVLNSSFVVVGGAESLFEFRLTIGDGQAYILSAWGSYEPYYGQRPRFYQTTDNTLPTYSLLSLWKS